MLTRFNRRTGLAAAVATVLAGVCALDATGLAHGQRPAEIGGLWPPISAYGGMDCSQLGAQLAAIGRDLDLLQQPANLENPKWQEASNRFGLLLRLYSPTCRRMLPSEQKIAPPPVPAGTPQEVRVHALKALKNRRLEAAQAWLLHAAERGDIEAQYNLGAFLYVVLSKRDEAEIWLRRAAFQGSADAQSMLRSFPPRQ